MRDNIELDKKGDGERSGGVAEKELNDQNILYEALKEYKICLNWIFKERDIYIFSSFLLQNMESIHMIQILQLVLLQ